MEPYTGAQALTDLLAELDTHDPEHPDVAVSDKTGWTLSAFPSGRVVWENVEEDGPPRHLSSVARAEVHRLFTLVAQGDWQAVEALPWAAGYGG